MRKSSNFMSDGVLGNNPLGRITAYALKYPTPAQDSTRRIRLRRLTAINAAVFTDGPPPILGEKSRSTNDAIG